MIEVLSRCLKCDENTFSEEGALSCTKCDSDEYSGRFCSIPFLVDLLTV